MRKIFPTKLLYIFFTLLLVVFGVLTVYLYTLPSHDQPANFWINAYGSFSVLSGLIGLLSVLLGPDRKSTLSKAMTILCVALIINGLGYFYWLYNNLANNIAIPYPSLGEYLFLTFPILLYIGFWMMMSFFRPLITWRVVIEAIVLTIISSALIFNYFIIPNLGDQTTFFSRFVTVTIPWEDAFTLALVYIALRVSGGKFRRYFWLYIFAMILLIAADFTFQYRNSIGIYWNGDISDSLFILNGYVFSLAVIATLQDTAKAGVGVSTAPTLSNTPPSTTTTTNPTTPPAGEAPTA